MCCSSLKYDLYRNKLIDSPNCECGLSEESAFHDFFECTLYSIQRNSFLEELSEIRNIQMNISSILHGSPTANQQENKQEQR